MLLGIWIKRIANSDFIDFAGAVSDKSLLKITHCRFVIKGGMEMVRQFYGIALLLAITIAASGCCIDRFGGCGYYNGGTEEYSVNECCGSNCGRHSPYERCGRGSCLRKLTSPFRRLASLATCGGGCGEVYWDEWLSDPPDCCDPCDDCGNWTGDGCCLPRVRKLLSRKRHVWRDGRCSSGCGGCGECDGCDSASQGCDCESCGGGQDSYGAAEYHGFSLPQGAVIQPTPRRATAEPHQPTQSVLRNSPATKTTFATPRYAAPRVGSNQIQPGEVLYER